MNEFSDALIDTGKKGKIPKEYDWFGFLIGECFMRRDDPADALRTFLSHAH